MGVAQVALNPGVVLEEIRRTLDQAPDAKALREIRKILDEPAFFAILSEYLRGVNDPDTKSEILSDLIDISRHCSDKSAQRKNQLTNVRYGIGTLSEEEQIYADIAGRTTKIREKFDAT